MSAVEELLCNQDEKVSSRGGDMYEMLHAVLALANPQEKWTYFRYPPMSIAYALAELIWILAGSEDSKVINFWNPILPKFAGNTDTYPGAYGYRIRNNFSFDQLDYAYRALKDNPQNRQTVILIWDPQKDFPTNGGQPRSADIPCNICSLLKVRDNKLEWTQIMRSNDVYRGLPYNLVQFTSIQEVLAGWLGIEVGEYVHYSDSLHLYASDAGKLKVSKEFELRNQDSLVVSKDRYDAAVDYIFTRMTAIAYDDVNEHMLLECVDSMPLETAYRNIMIVIATYAARKFGYLKLKQKLINMCTNELYKRMWVDWDEQWR